jgi:hypothetical protein
MELRQGNISISGIFLEIDESVGKAEDVHTLHLATIDRSESLILIARVARVFTKDDIWRGKVVIGTAWEFLFEKDEQKRRIERFVHRVAELQRKEAEGLDIAYYYNAQVDNRASGARAALVTGVGLNGILIETDWPIKEGETLKVEIEAPASKKKMHLEGRATSTRKVEQGDLGRYQVEVKFVPTQVSVPRSGGNTIANALDQLLSETAKWSPGMPPSSHEHLRGDLAQIRLSSVLAFVELERMSGIVRLQQEGEAATLHIREGQIIDAQVQEDLSKSPIEAVFGLLRWTKGSFEFRLQPVDGNDNIGRPTSALLIEQAQREDESHSS